MRFETARRLMSRNFFFVRSMRAMTCSSCGAMAGCGVLGGEASSHEKSGAGRDCGERFWAAEGAPACSSVKVRTGTFASATWGKGQQDV
jgi:hypothetical protein